MRTYRFPGGGLARALRHSGALVFTLASVSVAQAQERRIPLRGRCRRRVPVIRRRYRAWVAQSVDWRESACGFRSTSRSRRGLDPSANTIASQGQEPLPLLYNLPLGQRNWGYAKPGAGGTRYGSTATSACTEIPGKDLRNHYHIRAGGLGSRIGLSPC